MKVTIRSEECAGCNMCDGISGGMISSEMTGKARLKEGCDLENKDIQAMIKLAAMSCPMQIIEVTE